MPQPPSIRSSTTGRAEAGPNVRKLIEKITEISQRRYKSVEDRALFETFIVRLGQILDEKRIENVYNVRIQEDSVVWQSSHGIPVLVLPGVRNRYGSVTGYFFTEGGWGAPTPGNLECPSCNGDNFRYFPGPGETSSNFCPDCGYRETFLC